MSRVHCPGCGSDVVVDPTGLCPEGHHVRGMGVRIERAMGDGAPHPEEPEPWVASVELDEPEAVVRERVVRPVQVRPADAGDRRPEAPAEPQTPADHEAMLRELHALGEFGAVEAAPRAATPAPTSTPAPPATAVAGTTAGAVPPSREDVAAGFAELSALEAAVQALGFDDGAEGNPSPDAPTDPVPGGHLEGSDHASDPGPTAHPGGDAQDLDDLEALFGAPPAPGRGAARPPACGTDATSPPVPPDLTAARAAPAPLPPPVATTPAPLPPPPPAPADAAPLAPAPSGDRGSRSGDPEPRSGTAAATGGDPAGPAAPAALDITNFTSRGGKVGAGRSGGRRKLFRR